MADRSKLVIGLTGGIGSGKSTVAELFEALGATVIDTDVLAREVVEPGTPGLQAVVAHFTSSVLDSNGHLNRAKLRERVFNNEQDRRELEALLHPMIRAEMETRIGTATGPYCVVCIPLLLETGRQDSVDRVLVVDTTRQLQLKRALARDGSPRATIESILNTQVDRTHRVSCADDVIDNSTDLRSLEPQVNRLHQRYLEMADALHGHPDRRRM